MSKERKYATIDQGMNFRAISVELKKDGYTLGASRIRTVMVKILCSITKDILKKLNREVSHSEVMKIITNTEFQNNIAPIIEDAYARRA